MPGTPSSSQDSSTAIPPTDQTKLSKAVSPNPPAIASPKPQNDVRPSPLPGKPIQASEQPLSPASSAGPYSNNTPALTAASPATSPAEETAEPVGKAASPKRTAATQGQSGFVPTTPDEQLRFEEAQSLQQNALLASQVKDGAGVGSLANQVIQEDLP